MTSSQTWRRLGWLFIYAAAMGLFEAICVIYLRRLLASPGAQAAALEVFDRTRIEVTREACTLAMILAVAWISGNNLRSRSASFFFIFGVWDVLYYAGLKWLADWPAGWREWDCLFLIPEPWYGPVLAPVLISAYFVFASALILAAEAQARPIRVSWMTVGSQFLAGAVWYWSFVKDSRQIVTHGCGELRYSWLALVAGLGVASLGLWMAWAARAAKDPSGRQSAPAGTQPKGCGYIRSV